MQLFFLNVIIPLTGAVTAFISLFKIFKKQAMLSEVIEEMTNVDGSRSKKVTRKFK
jgi:hypothetical protein